MAVLSFLFWLLCGDHVAVCVKRLSLALPVLEIAPSPFLCAVCDAVENISPFFKANKI